MFNFLYLLIDGFFDSENFVFDLYSDADHESAAAAGREEKEGDPGKAGKACHAGAAQSLCSGAGGLCAGRLYPRVPVGHHPDRRRRRGGQP